MPMNFPDLAALRRSFDHPKSLPYRAGESEAQYRERCAVWSVERWGDHVQAQEIRTGKGWDRWNEGDQLGLLRDMNKAKPAPSSTPDAAPPAERGEVGGAR